uniref:Antibiotic biosynthesis monooxygenase n=1 Tax=Rhabditophanes sp. KR3021 TaxID=114890 RepID=A0AC35TJS3_9BILA
MRTQYEVLNKKLKGQTEEFIGKRFWDAVSLDKSPQLYHVYVESESSELLETKANIEHAIGKSHPSLSNCRANQTMRFIQLLYTETPQKQGDYPYQYLLGEDESYRTFKIS